MNKDSVKKIIIENIEAGCNNGNYPLYKIEFTNNEVIRGKTCRCHRGCSNTDNILEYTEDYKKIFYEEEL